MPSPSTDLDDALALPHLDQHGYLPAGIHSTGLLAVEDRFCFNVRRRKLWNGFRRFYDRVLEKDGFRNIYLDGGFISGKTAPTDLDTILEPVASYGLDALEAMRPFFTEGIKHIQTRYGVHLHFWVSDYPEGFCDFRQFFQYHRPAEAAPFGISPEARKGIVKLELPS